MINLDRATQFHNKLNEISNANHLIVNSKTGNVESTSWIGVIIEKFRGIFGKNWADKHLIEYKIIHILENNKQYINDSDLKLIPKIASKCNLHLSNEKSKKDHPDFCKLIDIIHQRKQTEDIAYKYFKSFKLEKFQSPETPLETSENDDAQSQPDRQDEELDSFTPPPPQVPIEETETPVSEAPIQENESDHTQNQMDGGEEKHDSEPVPATIPEQHVIQEQHVQNEEPPAMVTTIPDAVIAPEVDEPIQVQKASVIDEPAINECVEEPKHSKWLTIKNIAIAALVASAGAYAYHATTSQGTSSSVANPQPSDTLLPASNQSDPGMTPWSYAGYDPMNHTISNHVFSPIASFEEASEKMDQDMFSLLLEDKPISPQDDPIYRTRSSR